LIAIPETFLPDRASRPTPFALSLSKGPAELVEALFASLRSARGFDDAQPERLIAVLSYRCFQLAGRFSTNAAMPSFLSTLPTMLLV
jgi:hypothetical protein